MIPHLIDQPAIVPAPGNLPKSIEEYVGRSRLGHEQVSVARMVSPPGWEESGQRPDFEEISLVLKGMLRVEHERGHIDVHAGQAILCHPRQWVRYSTPGPEGAEYIAVCMPAFAHDAVHRDES